MTKRKRSTSERVPSMPSSKKRVKEKPTTLNSLRSEKELDGSKGDYAVGKGKPPKHTQFKKGDGRHRPGRPKGSKNMVTMVLEAARDQVPVTIDGKRRKISKAQAAAINLANAAATGNPKFVLQFIDLIAGITLRPGRPGSIQLDLQTSKILEGSLMDQKTFTIVAGVVFLVVALFHLVRIYEGWPVEIGDWSIPMWVSWIGLIVAGGLAFFGFNANPRLE